jgi:hypothetical protein
VSSKKGSRVVRITGSFGYYWASTNKNPALNPGLQDKFSDALLISNTSNSVMTLGRAQGLSVRCIED